MVVVPVFIFPPFIIMDSSEITSGFVPFHTPLLVSHRLPPQFWHILARSSAGSDWSARYSCPRSSQPISPPSRNSMPPSGRGWSLFTTAALTPRPANLPWNATSRGWSRLNQLTLLSSRRHSCGGTDAGSAAAPPSPSRAIPMLLTLNLSDETSSCALTPFSLTSSRSG